MMHEHFSTNIKHEATYALQDLFSVKLKNDNLRSFISNWDQVIAGIPKVPEVSVLRLIFHDWRSFFGGPPYKSPQDLRVIFWDFQCSFFVVRAAFAEMCSTEPFLWRGAASDVARATLSSPCCGRSVHFSWLSEISHGDFVCVPRVPLVWQSCENFCVGSQRSLYQDLDISQYILTSLVGVLAVKFLRRSWWNPRRGPRVMFYRSLWEGLVALRCLCVILYMSLWEGLVEILVKSSIRGPCKQILKMTCVRGACLRFLGWCS